jgi:hypothetical protein
VRRVPVPQPVNLDEGATLPIIIPNVDLTFIIDGIVQVVEPKPDQFTINVLLLGQLLIPNATASQAAGSALKSVLSSITATNLEQQSRVAIDRFFKYSKDAKTNEEKGWHVVWMGVED